MRVMFAKHIKLFGIISLACFLIGCSAQKSDTETSNSELPELNTFDPQMSKASFLSAEKKIPTDNKEYTDYEVRYVMRLSDTTACFALGDRKGEYGELVLCELGTGNDKSTFGIKRMSNGRVLTNDIQSVDITGMCSENDDSFEVKLKVKGERLEAFINGYAADAFDIPETPIGTVGVYKARSTSYAYIDELEVTADGKTLFYEDFEGKSINNVYPYDYESEYINIFSPFYTKTENGALRVSSGLTLTETYADAAPLFRKEFTVDKNKIDRACLYMTALGSFENNINGKPVSESYFEPGKMFFSNHLDYTEYDVTGLIENENTWDIMLYHGFYDRGNGYPEVAKPWGDMPAVRGELVIEYKNGNVEIIPTDSEFKVNYDTNVRFNDIYHGEIIDERYSVSDKWGEPLVNAVDKRYLEIPLRLKSYEPVGEIMSFPPMDISEPEPGVFVYDFGQNFSGTVSIKAEGMEEANLLNGQVLTLRYGELINSDDMLNRDDLSGTVWTQNLLSARATDYYVSDGAASEVNFRHTCHGFRYLQITGADKAISLQNIEAHMLSTPLEATGEFVSSDEDLNRLYENARFSVLSNFVDLPSDCAQRDERLAWAGDAQDVSLFAGYIFDTEKFYENYLDMLISSQAENGAFPDIAAGNSGGNNCWGDAPVVIAWNLYMQYGNTGVLSDNIEAFKRWVDYLVETSEDFLRDNNAYGDHLALQGTPKSLSDTAWCAHSAQLVSKMSAILGNSDDAERYNKIYESYAERWCREYLREDGSVEAGIILSDAESQTAYALGIAFELFPEGMLKKASDRLDVLTQYGGNMFYAGYSGLNYVLPSLARYGHMETAMNVLSNKAPDTLMHTVSFGLTTMPEQLNAIRYDENGKYEVNGSLNHFAYASVCAFFYTDILGIRPDEEKPGYEHFYIEPKTAGALSYASGTYACKYGTISVEWNVPNDTLKCRIPDDTTCTLIFPSGTVRELEAGKYEFRWSE